MTARNSKDYDLKQVSDFAVEYLREEYPEVEREVKKCEEAEAQQTAVSTAAYSAAAGTMAASAVASAGASSLMGGMAANV